MSEPIIDRFKTYVSTELCLSQETLSAYTRDVQEFLAFVGTKDLSAQQVENFVSHLRSNGRMSTTIRRKSMSIRCLYNCLISLGMLKPEVLNIIDPVRTTRRSLDVLDSEDVDVLVSTARECAPIGRAANVRRNVAIILTAYHSGLRVSEICNLKIGDIKFDRREIRVGGKGGRDRIVPTTKQCAEAISTYINNDRQSVTNHIFVKSDGQPITRRAITDMIISLSRRAGIKHTTAHLLRRTSATKLMDNGMDLELIQRFLGHKNLSTTELYLSVNLVKLKSIHGQYHPFGAKCAEIN